MGPMCLSLLCLVPLLTLVPLVVLALVSTEWVTAQSMHSSKSSEIFCYHSRMDSQTLTTKSRPSVKPWVWSPPELPVLNRPSMPSLPRWRCLQHWNRTSAPLQKTSALSLHAFAKLKRMQRPSPMVPTRQDLGTYLDIVTAPQPLGLSGPMAQGHLMTVEIRGVDLILSPAPKMNNRRSAVLLRFPCEQYHKGITKWINNLWEESNVPARTTSLSEFIAKQVLCRSGLLLKHEPNVKTLLFGYKDDGISLCNFYSPFLLHQYKYLCPPIQINWRPERLESNVRLCGENWLNHQINVLFPDRDDEGAFIIPALDTRSHVPQHQRSQKRSWKTGGQACSSGSGQLFTLVALDMCVLGVSGEVLQRVISQAKQVNVWWPPFASSPCCRLACRGALFCGFPFRWFLHFALSLTRSIIVHVATPHSRVNPLSECSRPCDNLSFLCFTALWLQQSQSLLMQENQPGKDIDLTCFKTFPIKATTSLLVGPMSLDWPVDPIARIDQSRPSSSPEDPNDEHKRGALPASTRSRWRQDALRPPQVLQGIAGRDTCGHFPDGGLRCITWNTRGLVGSVFSSQKNRELEPAYFREALWQQQHLMSPGGSRKGWVSPGYSGVGSAI